MSTEYNITTHFHHRCLNRRCPHHPPVQWFELAGNRILFKIYLLKWQSRCQTRFKVTTTPNISSVQNLISNRAAFQIADNDIFNTLYGSGNLLRNAVHVQMKVKFKFITEVEAGGGLSVETSEPINALVWSPVLSWLLGPFFYIRKVEKLLLQKLSRPPYS